MPKIYTKTGDNGITSLSDGNKVSKTCIIFDVLGEIDELSCRIGDFCSILSNNNFNGVNDINNEIIKQYNYLRLIQCKLQNINSSIAVLDNQDTNNNNIVIFDDELSYLELNIDNLETFNSKLVKFILPGVTIYDSKCHLCRTQTRKVERKLLKLNNCQDTIHNYNKNNNQTNLILNINNVKVQSNILKYINRLSDYFFVLSRYLTKILNKSDIFTEDYIKLFK